MSTDEESKTMHDEKDPADDIPIVLAGPTGSGKSGLALKLADEVNGVIICADSRQVFEHMRIGSAGPTLEEIKRIPHLGYHCISPKEAFAAGDFLRTTDENVAKAKATGNRAILVGGTGMYLRAWRYGLDDVPRAKPELRAELNAELEKEGVREMHRRLALIDPVTAAKVEPTDPVRIIRGLEVYAMTGKTASELRSSHCNAPPRQHAHFFLLNPSREWLLPRIQRRAQQMFDEGLVKEAVALKAFIDDDSHRLLNTMGYEEALLLDEKRLSLEEAVEKTHIRQRQYARRQRTWFKKESWWTVLDINDDDDVNQAYQIMSASI
ncbi:MAG: tRNA (adenosine(37)-N6)-dimethylallyltransferase MiaA [Deltaproteobacteria bacterium]|nr:tRNA (adenosine(37)-N6)-dimethylallyltransferase MiaA [Deltaproteobacteria bacterium]